jgi:DNA-binding LytR/AlgR family response regulator
MIPNLPGSFTQEHAAWPALISIGGERIDPTQVIYLEGSGNYTFIHFETRPKLVVAITLSKVTQQLPTLVRVHKSYSVNVGKIDRTRRARKGKGKKSALTLTLQGGTRVEVSRRRNHQISDVLGLQK